MELEKGYQRTTDPLFSVSMSQILHGTYYSKTVFVVYLKFRFNWASCFSGVLFVGWLKWMMCVTLLSLDRTTFFRHTEPSHFVELHISLLSQQTKGEGG